MGREARGWISARAVRQKRPVMCFVVVFINAVLPARYKWDCCFQDMFVSRRWLMYLLMPTLQAQRQLPKCQKSFCCAVDKSNKCWRHTQSDSQTNRQTDWQHMRMVRRMNKTDRRSSLQRCRWANYWQQYCISDIKVLQRRPWQLCSEAENYGYLKSSSFRAVLIVFPPPTTPKVPNSPSSFLSVLHPSYASVLGAHFRFPC